MRTRSSNSSQPRHEGSKQSLRNASSLRSKPQGYATRSIVHHFRNAAGTSHITVKITWGENVLPPLEFTQSGRK